MDSTAVIKRLHDALTEHHKLGLAKGAVYQRSDLCDKSLLALVAARDLPIGVSWQDTNKRRNLNPTQKRKKPHGDL